MDTPRPPSQNLGVATPNPRIDAYMYAGGHSLCVYVISGPAVGSFAVTRE